MSQTAWLASAILVALGAAAAGYWTGARNAAPPTQPLVQGNLAAAPKGTPPDRKIRFYRNPMGLPDTSLVPKNAALPMRTGSGAGTESFHCASKPPPP